MEAKNKNRERLINDEAQNRPLGLQNLLPERAEVVLFIRFFSLGGRWGQLRMCSSELGPTVAKALGNLSELLKPASEGVVLFPL